MRELCRRLDPRNVQSKKTHEIGFLYLPKLEGDNLLVGKLSREQTKQLGFKSIKANRHQNVLNELASHRSDFLLI